MIDLYKLSTHVYADGADKESLLKLYDDPVIKGLTTNPTLMRKAGVADYEAFARDVLLVVKDKPISFEILADDFPEMIRQAKKIAAWQKNVFVKIPITNAQGNSCKPVIEELSREGVQVNVTAILNLDQMDGLLPMLQPDVPAIISIFAGRIADTGRDPEPVFVSAKKMIRDRAHLQLLWASVREVFNIIQAERCGCDIVTVPFDILTNARKRMGMDLTALSIETVQMFYNDAQKAGFRL